MLIIVYDIWLEASLTMPCGLEYFMLHFYCVHTNMNEQILYKNTIV